VDTKQTVMDIAMNLNRIGNWIADGYEPNKKKVEVFTKNTDDYISTIQNLSQPFEKTWSEFMRVYPLFKKNIKKNAENLMTWGNILTHRSKLIR